VLLYDPRDAGVSGEESESADESSPTPALTAPESAAG